MSNAMTSEEGQAIARLLLRPTETCQFVLCIGENNRLENRILAIIVNTQAGVEEACVFIIKRTGLMAGVIQAVLPVYFDFRISVAQTKPVDKEDKPSTQDYRNDFTLKLLCDQTEVSVQTDNLDILQGLLRELRRSHLIAQDDNFYAGGSSHRWVQYYTTVEDDQKVPELAPESILTMDEFIASTSNPLATYFLQPEESQPGLFSASMRLDLGAVKESWIEKEMRARESAFTEYSSMHAFVGTWNVNGRNAPDSLDAWLNIDGEAKPDIYVLCFQELDLSAEAYIVLDSSKEEEWTRAIGVSLGSGYHKVMSKQLVGLLIVMYAKNDHAGYIKEVTAHSAGVGIMGMLGNKGGVSIRIRYKDSYLCFVDSHLAADASQVERRNQDYQEICRRLAFPSINPYDITKSPAGNAALAIANKMVSIFQCDHTIWAGDLNYRIGLSEEHVKALLKTNDYQSLLKHDQLELQRKQQRAFAGFEEHPIAFSPTYKYDVGTNTWDSSEKRRVPAYTDRILWRSKDLSEDSVETLFYRSHMELMTSDHKPVSALFKLKVKTLLHDKQAEVYQAIVRDLDKYENDCMPDATISSANVIFDEVRYLEPKTTAITIKNTGGFPTQYRFKPKLQDERFCRPWMWVNPPVAMIMPGESAKIHLTVMVDNESAPLLNTGKEKMDDILILHLEHGKDYFISVSGTYIRTCFGNSLEWLSRIDRPVRLWNPEDDEDDDEDDTATLYDPYNVLGSKSSMGSIKDSAAAVTGADGSRLVKSAKSLDSLSDRGRDGLPGAFPGSQLLDEKPQAPAPAKKQKSVRQLSLPKDLWRIVDFIYKYGFSVDNLFLLSGDQPTMSYIRECLDTGEEFDLTRLLDKHAPQQDDDSSATAASSNPSKNKKKGTASAKGEQANDESTTSSTPPSHPPSSPLSTRGSVSDLKPQIARPVSILNGIPPKAANFGLGENRGVHSMAEVLIRFLESLREPVVPTEMYYRALEVSGHQQAAYGLLDLMPPVHVNVFVYITSFLRELILVGGNYGAATGNSSGKEGTGGAAGQGHGGFSAAAGAAAGSTGAAMAGSSGGTSVVNGTNRVLQGSSGSVYNVTELAGALSSTGGGATGGRMKREDEDFRVAKLAAVFSSVMLRPPPGSERLSEVEALKRKTFIMQFLQEPAEEEGLGGAGGGFSAIPPASSSSVAGASAYTVSSPSATASSATTTVYSESAES